MFHKIRELSKDLAIYGLGDVAVSVVNFLLLPIYVQYLSKEDYAVLALLGGVEAFAKLFFRWGLDGSFMRLWYDCGDAQARRRLTSTIFLFLLAVNGVLLVGVMAGATQLAIWLGTPTFALALQLVLLNTFAVGFTFIPFHVLRIQQRSREFSALAFARSAATVVLRIWLVIGMGLGVLGVVIADLTVTIALFIVLARTFTSLIRTTFSWPILRESLAFGLPRVPHGLLQQIIAVGDKFILTAFVPLAQIGLYSIGVSVGLIQKIFLAAFESAWAPFYYSTAREPDAPRVFSAVTTYGIAVLALMTAGLSAVAGDLLQVITHGQYTAAAGVVGWTALGVFFQGIYLMTSIGLNITRRTKYYPVSTAAAAVVNVGLNLLLIPRFGIMGAAYANGAAYAAQAGVAFYLSQRFYPVVYERERVVRVLAAALLAYLAGRLLPDMPAFAGLLARGTTVLGVMAGVMYLGGFFRPAELRVLTGLRRRPSADHRPLMPPAETTEFAGEIVTADLPDPAGPAGDRREPA